MSLARVDGEWVAFFGHRPAGIPSPVELNRRHVAVLAAVFAKGLVPLPKRLGIATIKPKFFSLVLVSNNARISRPKGRAAAARVDGLETVIKVDQFAKTIDRAYDERSLAALGRVVSADTIESIARQLVALHVPATIDWAARFGLPPTPPPAPMSTSVAPAPTTGVPTAVGRPGCASCGRTVSSAVIAYCEANAARFGGATYCMTCQRAVGRA